MGGGADGRMLEQVAAGFRFVVEYIEASVPDTTGLEGFEQSTFVHQTSTGTIDDRRSMAHHSQSFCIQEGLVKTGYMKGQVMAFAQAIFQGEDFNLEFIGGGGSKFGVLFQQQIVGDNPHSETAGNSGYFLANTAESHNAQRFAKQFSTRCVG